MINKKQIETLFNPKSIAVVGASENIEKIGGYIFEQIKKVKDITPIPINVKSEKIQGFKAYTSLEYAPKGIDLVIICVPSIFAVDILEECAELKIKNVVIITAGFKETGDEGKLREEKIKEIIRENNMNIVGPNCLGFLNANINLNCSFAKDLPISGDVALVSQSGAVIDAIIDWSLDKEIGFSKVVSCGNMAGLNQLDFLEYLEKDPKTSAIVFYMESLDQGEEFSKAVKRVTKKKPVIIIKPGNSKNAQKAIGSHTGSLAGNNVLTLKLLEESNCILTETLEELYGVFEGLFAKPSQGKNLVIVTNAGGPGVIATDILEKTNFTLYQFSASEKKKLASVLPKEASVNNPIDVLGDAKSDRYFAILNELEKNKNVHNILVLLTPQIMTDCEDIAKKLVEFNRNSNKCIFSSFLGGFELSNSFEIFKENKFANFQTPHTALTSINKFLNYNTFDYGSNIKKIDVNKASVKRLNEIIENKKGILDYETSNKILKSIGVEMPQKQIVNCIGDLFSLKLKSNENYVIKGEGIVHKKEEGAVITNVPQKDVHDTCVEMLKKLSNKYPQISLTIEKQVKGHEVIVGLNKDSNLGSFIMFGMGGSYVNVFKDANFSKAPISKENTKKLIQKSIIYPILNGYRGDKAINMKALEDVIFKLSQLQEFYPSIKEVDCNPIICNENGVYLVDVKLLI